LINSSTNPGDDGWDASAQAWIAEMGQDGDWGRRHVLDTPMLERVSLGDYATALDLGCGEGRFCRRLQALGIATIGIDPTAALIERARALDAAGDYRVARAEALDLDDACVELVVAYLSLIDIADLQAAIAECARVLKPRGRLLIANLQPFNTASTSDGWHREPDGQLSFRIDDYLQERPIWSAWRGIRIRNWHRPLQSYLATLLDAGFELRHFAEPAPVGSDDAKAQRYRRVPNFLLMEWEKRG
jgi:SAM-dependent methyltransferase